MFVDRDGTLIRDVGYCADSAQVEVIPGSVWAMKKCRERGFALIVISNQSGIGRGLITQPQAIAVHNAFVGALQRLNIDLAGCYYCPHAPWKGCGCRKPLPELVFRAARELSIDLGRSIFVGNNEIDLETGQNAGIPAFILKDATVRSWKPILNTLFEKLYTHS